MEYQRRKDISNDLFKGTIDAIKEATDVRLLLDMYNVDYKVSPDDLKFRSYCPIHGGDRPDALLFNNETKSYKCFTKGCSGDVFKFVMEMESCTFWEAARKLADLNNINIDQIDQRDIYKSKYEKYIEKAKTFSEMMDKKKREFDVGANIHRDEKELKKYPALPKYCSMKSRRGVDWVTQEDFDIRIGRIGGDPYRHLRIIIPIHDEFGNYIAYLGRTWYTVDRAKYWYTPPGLAKNMFVFNLHRAKRYVLDWCDNVPTLFVCEGAFDVIKLWQMGYKNAVAIFGSEPTESQFRLMTSVANRIVLCFDNDKSGVKATKQMLSLITNSNANIQTLVLPIPTGVNDVGEMTAPVLDNALASLMTPIVWLKKTKERVDI